MVIPGHKKEVGTLPGLLQAVRIGIGRLYGDTGYASRRNVQMVADWGGQPVINPQQDATPRAKGCPAWRRLVLEYRELGYEGWAGKTGYQRRFQEEHALAALINKSGDQVPARCPHMAARLLLAMICLRNLMALLYHRC